VQLAKQNGLKTAGIMDHDSVGGAWEFIHAGKEFDMPVTVGIECRVDMSKTILNGRRINNPDQNSVIYVAMHGIPHQNIENVNDYFAPYRAFRNERNRRMCGNITDLTGIYLDFDRDVLPISNYRLGGSVTERHILFALVKKIVNKYQTPEEVTKFLNDILDGSKKFEYHPDYYEYDILGILKANMVEKIYVNATKECPDVKDFIKMVREYGGIAAYIYLGDVGDSVTGDKRTQKFEDDYLDLLIDVLKELGFDAVTYMPTRNTPAQLDRIMKLCADNGFFQISGEDINSPRQSFICKAYEDPKFNHLIKAAYTLIEYENAATINIEAAREKFDFIFRKS